MNTIGTKEFDCRAGVWVKGVPPGQYRRLMAASYRREADGHAAVKGAYRGWHTYRAWQLRDAAAEQESRAAIEECRRDV